MLYMRLDHRIEGLREKRVEILPTGTMYHYSLTTKEEIDRYNKLCEVKNED